MLSTNPDPICHRSISRRKRPIEVVPHASKLRSTIPRRRRIPLHPIVDGSSNAPFDAEGEAEPASSYLGSAISSESSLVFAGSGALKRTRSPCQRVWNSEEIGRVSPENEFRRITRAYARRRERLRSPESKEDGGRKVGLGSTKRSKIEENTRHATVETSVSEVSGGFPDENLKNGDVASKTVEIDPEISQTSCLESVSDAIAAKIPKSASEEGGRSQFSQNFASRGEEPRDQDLDSDLVCSEEFSSRDRGSSEYSTCNKTTLSELEAELFARSSEGDSSEYSLSVLADSSSDDLSEKSCENSAPSATFSLFIQFSQQFSRSNLSSESSSSPGIREDSPQEFTLTRFEEEDEESYKRFRSRESMEAVLRDYAEEYSLSTDYGDLILEQRLQMVNWIVEHSNAMELRGETLFLGVSLMDRFLSRGYFRTERNLQLLGIACVTLATRLEENQPYNSIRQKCFKVGNNVYTRTEVVAMEWLVQEVLKFQCFLPTIHHFLWFYLKAAGADTNVENLSRYLAVLSLLDHERLYFKPSTVAAGLVILACLATNNDSSCLTVMETHVRTKNDDLPECIQSLEWLVKYVC